MIKKWHKKLSNYPRLRVLLLLVGILAVIIILANIFSNSTAPKTNLPPSSIPSVNVQPNRANPVVAERYAKLAQEAQQRNFQNVTSQGQSYLAGTFNGGNPVPISLSPDASDASSSTQNTSNSQTQAAINDAVAKATASAKEEQAAEEKQLEAKYVAQQQELAQREAALDDRNRQLQQNMNHIDQQQTQTVNALQSAMQAQAQNLSSKWTTLPTFQQVVGVATSSSSKEGGKKVTPPALITAGTVYYGVLDTAVSSDQADAPVMATIEQGPFKNAKLLGAFRLEGERLVVQFDSMTAPGAGHTIPITAYAIDGVTAQNALVSDVDHHYLLRYGSLFAAAFLQGFGNAYANWQPSCGAGGDNCTIVTTYEPEPPSTKQALYQGLGQIGQNLSSEVGQYFSTPVTVTLNQGMGIGILFTKDIQG